MYYQQTIITEIDEIQEEFNEKDEYSKTKFDLKVEAFILDLIESGFIPAGNIIHYFDFINKKVYSVIPFQDRPNNGVVRPLKPV